VRAECWLQIQYLKSYHRIKFHYFRGFMKVLTFIPYCQNSQAYRISSDIFEEAEDNVIWKRDKKHDCDIVELEHFKTICV
jgi:hypothetical protein